MKKIAILTTFTPYAKSPITTIAESLKEALCRRAYEAIVVKIPFASETYEKMLEHILATRLLHVPNTDQIIALEFPTYYIEHPHKSMWLFQHYQHSYKTKNSTTKDEISNHSHTQMFIQNYDKKYLLTDNKIYSATYQLAKNISALIDVNIPILDLPPDETKCYRNEGYENYIFCPSDIIFSNRQHLLIESLKHTDKSIELYLTGNILDEHYHHQLQMLINQLNLQKRVHVLAVDAAENSTLAAKCLAFSHLPTKRSANDCIALEAFLSKKPIITTFDADENFRVVKQNVNALISEPNAVDIANKISIFLTNKKEAEIMGSHGLKILKKLNINWDHVIGKIIT